MRQGGDSHARRPMAARERCRPRGAQAASSTGACGRSLPAPPFPARRGRAAPGRAGPAALPGYPMAERPLRQSRRGGGGRRDGCGAAVAGRAQSGRGSLRSMVAPAALPAAGLFYWVGALGALYAAALASYRLLAGLRVWVLGSGAAAVRPELGAWAGECASRPPPPRLFYGVPPRAGTGTSRGSGLGLAGRGTRAAGTSSRVDRGSLAERPWGDGRSGAGRFGAAAEGPAGSTAPPGGPPASLEPLSAPHETCRARARRSGRS